MAKILKDKRAGVYFNLIAAFFCVIAMIGYTFAGQDSYGFVPLVEVFLALGIWCIPELPVYVLFPPVL